MRKHSMLLIIVFFVVCLSQTVFATGTFATSKPETADKPQVTLASCKVTNGKITAGGTVELEFTFMNNSNTEAVHSMIVTFENKKENLYTTFGVSNQAYVGNIEAGKKAVVRKEFFIPKSGSTMISLQLDMQYTGRDINHGIYTNSCTLCFPVLDSDGLNTQVIFPSTAYANTPMKITGVVGNSSEQTFKNLTIHIDGDFKDGETESVLGDLSPGQQISFEKSIVMENVGIVKNTSLFFSFDDDSGSHISTDPTNYTLQVLEENMQNTAGQNSPSMIQKLLEHSGSVVVLIISVIAFIILAIISRYIRNYQKQHS